jgi:carbamoyl-phosphate synthase large subunit
MPRKLRVGVTGLNATDNPGPGIPVIRCLHASRRYEVEAIGLSYDALEPGIYLPGMAAASYLMPYPITGYRNMLERLREIHAQSPLDLIIPCYDSELVAFVRMEDSLREMGIATFLPTSANLELRSKANLNAFGKSSGVPVPHSRPVYDVVQLNAALADFVYPVVVKGVFYEASICATYDEVMQAFQRLHKKWGGPVILQQYVKGDEYNIAAVGDGAGGTVGAVISKKIYVTDKGKGWSGISIRNDELMELTRRVIRLLRWRGALELEMMRAEATDHYMLLEINPRFPAWVFLSAGVGVNLPEMLVALALGEEPDRSTLYEPGRIFLRYSAELVIDLAELERMTVTSVYRSDADSPV